MKQIESIHFSGDYLIPFYGATQETYFLTTYESSDISGKYGWSIKVWLAKAEKGNEKASMAQAIAREEKGYKDAAEKDPNSPYVPKLKHGAKLMSKLLQQLANEVYHKKPEESFVRTVESDLLRARLDSPVIDTKKAILLAGINRFIER